jgi:hypothetical protein
VLTHFDAAAIAAQVPNPDVPGSGGLPQPRTALEAGCARNVQTHNATRAMLNACRSARRFFIATARAQGIYAFWGSSVDSSTMNHTLHWRTLGGENLVIAVGETRCVLVSSATSTTETHMHASLRPCSMRAADGVLSVAAAAAPPPPPGTTTQTYWDPEKAPPPPPSAKTHAMTLFQRTTIFGGTESICEGKVAEGSLHRLACTEFLKTLGAWTNIVGFGTTAPLCMPICWRSCVGNHVGGLETDSFNTCRQPACAASSCYDFLLRECDPVLHAGITEVHQTTCSIHPPYPPAPPRPPPSPPVRARAPLEPARAPPPPQSLSLSVSNPTAAPDDDDAAAAGALLFGGTGAFAFFFGHVQPGSASSHATRSASSGLFFQNRPW